MPLFRQYAQVKAEAEHIRERAAQAEHATPADLAEAERKAQRLDREAALLHRAARPNS